MFFWETSMNSRVVDEDDEAPDLKLRKMSKFTEKKWRLCPNSGSGSFKGPRLGGPGLLSTAKTEEKYLNLDSLVFSFILSLTQRTSYDAKQKQK